MQTHQQGKTGAGKLRTKIFSIIVVLIMLLGVAITLARIVPAKADTTGDYPYASIACVWSPYATTDTGNWCKKVDTSGKIISYQTPFKNAAFAARASHSFECQEVYNLLPATTAAPLALKSDIERLMQALKIIDIQL